MTDRVDTLLKDAGHVRGEDALLAALTGDPSTARTGKAVDPCAPLTFAQRSLWARDQLPGSGDAAGLHVPIVLKMTGALDVAKLQRALTAMVARHHGLRTRFVKRDDEPVQCVAPPLMPDLSPTEVDGVAAALEAAERLLRTPFDLTSEPPFKARLYRCAPDVHLFVLILHHIACDAWSLALIHAELRGDYLGEVLPDPDCQPADIAARQAATPAWEIGEARRYFADTLSDCAVPLALPVDTAASDAPSAADAGACIPEDVVADLTTFAASRGLTIFPLLLAAYGILIAQYADRSRFLIATPSANRSDPDVERTIGCLSASVPIAVSLRPEDSGATMAHALQAQFLETVDQPAIAWEDIASTLSADRRDMSALCEAFFTFQNVGATTHAGEHWEGIAVEHLALRRPSARFGILLTVLRTGDGLMANLEYSPRRMAPAHAQAFVDRYVHVLRTLIAWPDRSIATLDLVPEDQRAATGQVSIRTADGAIRPVGAYGSVFVAGVVADGGEAPGQAGRQGIGAADVPALWNTGRRGRMVVTPDGPVVRLDPDVPVPTVVVPASELPASATEPVEPDAGVVAALHAAWSQTLGRDDIGLDNNFFALGGDSILCLKAQSLLRRAGFQISIEQLFENQTIRELSATLAERALDPEPAATVPRDRFALLTPADRQRLPADAIAAHPLSGLQTGMLFHSRLDGNGTYHDYVRYRIRGADGDRLAGALTQVLSAHEIFATSIDPFTFGEPLQIVHPACRVTVTRQDVHGVGAAQAAALNAVMAADLARGFTFPADPPMRVALLTLDDGDHVVALSFHHALLDGWSEASLIAEVVRAYTTDDAVPASGEAQSAFVALEREAMANAHALDFWREQVSVQPVIELPCVPVARAGDAPHLVFSAGQVRYLETVATDWGVPLKSVLLAVHARVQATLIGADEIATGMVFNGRPETGGAEHALGMFLNTLPVRIRTGHDDLRTLARRCQKVEHAIHRHRHVPLQTIQELAGRRQLFSVAFNYTHFHARRDDAPVAEIEIVRRDGLARNSLAVVANFARDPRSGEMVLAIGTGDGGQALAATLIDLFRTTLAEIVEQEMVGAQPVRSTAAAAVLPASGQRSAPPAGGDGGALPAILAAAEPSWPLVSSCSEAATSRVAITRGVAADAAARLSALRRVGGVRWLRPRQAFADMLGTEPAVDVPADAPPFGIGTPAARCSAILAASSGFGTDYWAVAGGDPDCPEYLFGGPATGLALRLAGGTDDAPMYPVVAAVGAVELRVIGRDGRALPAGCVGELALLCPALGWGDRDQLRRTAAHFVPRPDGYGGRLYRPGIVAQAIGDGRVMLIGPVHAVACIAGFRFSAVVVACALGDLAEVHSADVRFADGQAIVSAGFTGSALGTAERRAAVEDCLATLFGAAWDNIRGQVSFAIEAVEPQLPPVAADVAEYRFLDPVSRIVAEVWAEALACDAIGTADNFFHLGGSSIAAMRMVAALEELFDVEIPLTIIFKNPTLAAFATALRDGGDWGPRVVGAARSIVAEAGDGQ